MFIRSLDTAKLHPSRPISLLFLPLNTNLTLAIKHQTETQKILNLGNYELEVLYLKVLKRLFIFVWNKIETFPVVLFNL